MNQDLLLLFHNDKKIYDLFMTNREIYNTLRYCEQSQLSTIETLVELVKVLADVNGNLVNQLTDVALNGFTKILIPNDRVILDINKGNITE